MTSDSARKPSQAVAIIGGAVAGAQLARMLADKDLEVTVFEQNRRPFGKIEDGLPRWHVALRNKEYEKIEERLSSPHIHFVPSTRVGRDVGFRELVDDWGYTAVVLACGAWRDRPLPIEGVDRFVGRGLVYQNPFIIAFNHAEDAGYSGPTFPPRDGAIVVGGGLASIDVVKVLMLETTREKLAALGHEVDVEALEKAGMDRMCASLGVKWEDLEIEGATLYYRREPEDMPLQEIPDGADEAKVAKVRANRKKMLQRTMDKYKFRFVGLSAPEAPIEEDGRLAGLVFRKLEKGEGRKLIPTDETFEARGSMVVSSIGSTPEPIEGVAMNGELFAFTDWTLGRLEGLPTVFSAGNVVTGKGNIIASRRHATSVGEKMLQSYLGLLEDGHQEEVGLLEKVEEKTSANADAIKEAVERLPDLPEGQLDRIRERVRARQDGVGFDGDLSAWLASAR